MKRFLSLVLLLCAVLMLFTGCSGSGDDQQTEKTDLFSLNRERMVGVWRMDTYVTDAGETHQFWDQEVVFVYNADGTASKSVAGELEYSATFSYNGTHLYTTAYYPKTGESQFRNDLCTAQTDALEIRSYDERATITLKRVDPATVRTAAVNFE